MSEPATRWKAVALVLAGVLVGALLIEPVGAHFTQNTKHLGKHAWRQVIKKKTRIKFYNKRKLDTGKAPKCRGVSKNDKMRKVGGVCIDRFENSIWTKRKGGTQITGPIPCHANGQDCKGKIFARSVAGVKPRDDITWFQAQAALTNSGKRLPTSAEWQMAAQGTPDSTACNISTGSLADTRANPGCVSAYGAFDMVGNLWEWVGDWDEVAADCETWSADFGDDLTCMGRMDGDGSNHSPSALARGGDFNDGSDAGVFAVGGIRPSSSGSNRGFRGAR